MTYTRRPNHYHNGARSTYRRNQQGPSHGRVQSRGRRVMAIDPTQFVKKATGASRTVTYTPVHKFQDFQIDERLKNAIIQKGYTTPTPIQDQTIPHVLLGRDVVGIANTGTGKTAAFLVPLLNKMLQDQTAKVLIVAPTRELAVQIRDELRSLSQGLSIWDALCIGGVGMHQQLRTLQRNPRVVIGTPGRLKDFINQGRLKLQSFGTVVLDEVDRMLDMGFIRDVQFIISHLPATRQSLFFSATISSDAKAIMETFLQNPITVSVKTSATAENVDQDVVRLAGRQKVDVLHTLLTTNGFEKVIVFGRTKWGIEKLSRALEERGLRVAALHGNKNQNQRQRALEAFRDNRIQALLATDVASRGLDIENVTHVINYDIPESYEDYIHRIGRTGRAEKKGTALTFID